MMRPMNEIVLMALPVSARAAKAPMIPQGIESMRIRGVRKDSYSTTRIMKTRSSDAPSAQLRELKELDMLAWSPV